MLIQLNKPDLLQMLEEPNNIVGQVWFGLLPEHPPFLSLWLRMTLGEVDNLANKQIATSTPSLDARTVPRVYQIELGHFIEMIYRDGFGAATGYLDDVAKAFVTIEIQDERLVADFIRVGVPVGITLG